MTLFPDAATRELFHPLARDETKLGAGVRAICGQLGVSDMPQRFADGSLPVYALGERRVLKLYPPAYVHPERDREAAVLEVLQGRLSVPTPELCAVGELEGWGYVLMSRLRGESLALSWPRLTLREREQLADGLGQALAELHAVRDARLGPARVDFQAFVVEQTESAQARQRSRALDPHWLEQIPDFLRVTKPADASLDCLLHTEVMREHLLVEPSSSGVHLSGLFDFEPAMLGPAEYDFGAAGLFFSCAEPGLLRRLLRAYGYSEAELDADLSRRLLALTLLHRYANFPWYLERLRPPPGVRTLEALAEVWWGL